MTTDSIKELAAVLRRAADKIDSERGHKTQHTLTLHKAADALEAMAGERDRTRADYEAMKAHNKELFGKLSAAEVESDRLKAAVSLFVNAYNKAHPMRTADFHSPGCACIRCAFDAARKALGGDA